VLSIVDERLSGTGQARITLRKQEIDERRSHLSHADDGDDLLRGSLLELERQIRSVESASSPLFGLKLIFADPSEPLCSQQSITTGLITSNPSTGSSLSSRSIPPHSSTPS